MNILYLGETKASSTSSQRLEALRRLGHAVFSLNPVEAIRPRMANKLISKFHYETGYRFLGSYLESWIRENLEKIKSFGPEIIWVNSGELLGPRVMVVLKSLGCPVVLYNNDDPTGNRDGGRFGSLLRALPYYDLCAVMRQCNVNEYISRGAPRVLRVWMSYDEVIHKPLSDRNQISEKFRTKVAFVGAWMTGEGRDELMLKLIDAGIPLSIWGNHWPRSKHWNKLKNFHMGPSLAGRDYHSAVQGAEICLGLLSKGNRDLHTRRSLEIPFSGGLFCAERTLEHTQLYRENEEALFWDTPEECIQLCRRMLDDVEKLEKIRSNGMARVRALGVGNEDVCRAILEAVASPGSDKSLAMEIPLHM